MAPVESPRREPGAGSAAATEARLTRWAIIVIAVTPGVIIALTVTAVSPVLPTIAKHFGAAHGRLLAQYFAATSGVGVMLGAPLGGQGVDRFGFRGVTLASLALYILAGVSGYFLESPMALLASRVALGMGAGAFSATAMALLGQRWEGRVRSQMLGYLTAIGSAVAIPTMVAAGYVGQAFGWRAPFLSYLLVAPLALLALWLPGQKARAQSTPRPVTPVEWRALAPILIGCVILYVVLFTASVQFPLLLADAGFEKAGVRSIILATQSAVGVVAALMFGPVSHWLGPRKLMLVILLILAGSLFAMGCVNGLPLALTTCLLSGVGMGLMPSHVGQTLLEAAPAEIRGRATAALTSARYLAQFLNPVLLGSLGAAIGLRFALILVGGAMVAWLLVFAVQSIAGGGAQRPAKA